MTKHIYILLFCLWAAMAQSCIFIDDDLSVCGKDYTLNYQMRLVTNMNMEINEVLTALEDSTIKQSLRRRMEPIFSDHAHDIDLSFYNTQTFERVHYLNDIIDDNRTSFTFYLPKESYRHLSVANIVDAENVNICDSLYSPAAALRYIPGDTLQSQNTGLFSARLDMEVLDSIDQEFEVNLYMVNSAVALVIDTTGHTVKDIDVYVTNITSGFALSDSLFDNSRLVTVHAEPLQTAPVPAPWQRHQAPQRTVADSIHQTCYTTVNFPSAESSQDDGSYWHIHAYTTLLDSTITETQLTISVPLPAGTLKIIKTQMDDKGAIYPIATAEVGASVTLDWKPAGEHNIII